VILPTAATGKNVVAEDATNPLVVYPYVPATLLNEHWAACAGSAVATNRTKPMAVRGVAATKSCFILAFLEIEFALSLALP